MYRDTDGTRHCLLVLGKNQEDGILIEAEGYPYARYHTLIPKGRQLYQMGQYPSLTEFNRQMTELAEQYIQKAIANQQDGMYRIPCVTFVLRGIMLVMEKEQRQKDSMMEE